MPLSTRCIISHRVVKKHPMTTATPSSANPWAYTPCLLSHFSKLSAINDQRVGDKPPPCGNPLPACTTMLLFPKRTWMERFSIILTIQFLTGLTTFHSSRAYLTERGDELSKAPYMSKKTPNAYCLWSIAFSRRLTSWCNALSVDIIYMKIKFRSKADIGNCKQVTVNWPKIRSELKVAVCLSIWWNIECVWVDAAIYWYVLQCWGLLSHHRSSNHSRIWTRQLTATKSMTRNVWFYLSTTVHSLLC